MRLFFFITFGLLTFLYLGYPVLLWIVNAFVRTRKAVMPRRLPGLSLIIAAHNEGSAIAGKIENLRKSRYPMERLEVILASDGSRDRTVERFEEAMRRWDAERPGEAPRWKVVQQPVQQGKSVIQNQAVSSATEEILIFSDAATHFDPLALMHLMGAFDASDVGCATGKARYQNTQASGAAASEGAYFAYERWIRGMESRLGMLTMGSGCMLAIRRSLYQPLQPAEGEDWVLTLRTVESGARVVQVDEAVAWDELATSSSGLFRTKVRIISKDFRALWNRPHLLNPFRYGRIAFALLAHKFLRWFSFLWMVTLLILSGVLYQGSVGMKALFWTQCLFYGAALMGAALEHKQGKRAGISRLASIPYNFCVVQAAAACGIWKAWTGRSEAQWQPIRQSQSAEEAAWRL